jgi:hypothetical protein
MQTDQRARAQRLKWRRRGRAKARSGEAGSIEAMMGTERDGERLREHALTCASLEQTPRSRPCARTLSFVRLAAVPSHVLLLPRLPLHGCLHPYGLQHTTYNIVSPAAIFSCNVPLIARLGCYAVSARHSTCYARWLELKLLLPAHVIEHQRRRQLGAVETPSLCRPRSVTCTSVSKSLVRGVCVVHEHITLEQYEQQKMLTWRDMNLVP